MNLNSLLMKHAPLWHGATHHAFLDGVRTGTLPPAAFDTWLVQDYRFVATALPAQALLVAQAPRRDHALLVGGLAALVAELDWFEAHLAARGLDPAASLHAVTRAYGDYLLVTARAPYPAALTACAVVERAYFEAWSGTLPAAPAYAEFADHWTTAAFRAYVDDLCAAADRALGHATPEQQRAADEAFVWTARYEAAFWQMAFAGS